MRGESKSIKLGGIEVCYIPPKMTKQEKNMKTLEYYKDVGILCGVAVGLFHVISGLR